MKCSKSQGIGETFATRSSGREERRESPSALGSWALQGGRLRLWEADVNGHGQSCRGAWGAVGCLWSLSTLFAGPGRHAWRGKRGSPRPLWALSLSQRKASLKPYGKPSPTLPGEKGALCQERGSVGSPAPFARRAAAWAALAVRASARRSRRKRRRARAMVPCPVPVVQLLLPPLSSRRCRNVSTAAAAAAATAVGKD